uniref:Uncharacterized protein n=1 Tax=Dunaliella tertiolecta TaxID=3047 RepID=A0A7S3VPU3_DUNTE
MLLPDCQDMFCSIFSQVSNSHGHIAQMHGAMHLVMSWTPWTPPMLRPPCRFSGGSHDDNTVAQGFKTAAAGGIIVCVCNYIFMFIFGSEEEGSEGIPAENKA